MRSKISSSVAQFKQEMDMIIDDQDSDDDLPEIGSGPNADILGIEDKSLSVDRQLEKVGINVSK